MNQSKNLNFKNIVRKVALIFLSFLVIVTTLPIDLAIAVQGRAKMQHCHKKYKSNSKFKASQNAPKTKAKSCNTIITPHINFSSKPSDKDITNACVFIEPIVALDTQATNVKENHDLAAALTIYFNDETKNPKPIENFISHYPKSKWNASLKYNLAVKYFNDRYLSNSLDYFNQAWSASKNDKSQAGIHLANIAIANLMELEARLGMMPQLKEQVKEIKGRSFVGSIEVKVKNAKDGLWTMENHPEIAFKCGPYAINNIYNLSQNKEHNHEINSLVKAYSSTIKGTNLLQIYDLAKKLGLNYKMAKRKPVAKFIVPCVMHWKVNHFATIVQYKNGWYQIKDPTFGGNYNAWVKSDVLENETDGYFLIPQNKTSNKALPANWNSVSNEEASQVWGKGISLGRDPAKTPTNPKQCMGNTCQPCSGMAKACAFSMQASLNIMDTPLFYKPPIGPEMSFLANYNYGEVGQPSTFGFPTLGPNWSLNFVAYLTKTSNKIEVNIPGGGVEDYQYTEPVTNIGTNLGYNLTSQATLIKTGVNSYNRHLPNGSIEVYGQPTGTDIILLHQIFDVKGNAVTINYDGNYRITSIIDALGQQTNLSYANNTPKQLGFYNITTITDPFGRSANFSYDSSFTYLTSITDCNGIISSFNYNTSNDFINNMTTPYGTTVFNQLTPPGNSNYPATGLQFTFPDNSRSVIENFITEIKQTLFYDRETMARYPSFVSNQNYSHAKVTKWLFEADSVNEAPVANYEQMPLESQTVYSYEGEQGSDIAGNSNKPIQVTRQVINNVAIVNLNGNVLNTGDTVVLSVINTALSNDCIESVSYVANFGDTYVIMATALAKAINNDANLQAIGVSAHANGICIILNSLSTSPSRYTSFVNLGSISQASDGGIVVSITNVPYQVNSVLITGIVTTNDVITITVNNSNLARHTININYTVQSTDTLSSIVSNLTNLINTNPTLSNNQITASASTNTASKYLSIYSTNSTFSGSLSSGATVAIAVGYSPYQLTGGIIGGNIAPGDVITLNVANTVLSPYSQTVTSISYTVKSGDTLNTIASSLANLINSNAAIQANGVSAIYPVLGLNNNAVFGLNSARANITSYTYTTNSGASEVVNLGLSNINNTQTWYYQYNLFGHVTQSIDPIGRQFNYLYDAGLVDLLEIRETQNNDNFLISKWEYINNQHIPSAYINGSGQATKYSYNIYGQLTSLTDALGDESNFNYYNPYPSNPNIPAVFLNTIQGPLAGNLDISTLTYDNYNRIQTITDSEDYDVTFAYDNLNRITLTTYPDSSTEQNIYDRLDAVQIKDRLGRWTTNNYNSMDQLVTEVDPLGRKTQYTWCNCGSLATLIDGNGNVTTYHHDLEGRTISKTYADGSQYSYIYDSLGRLQAQTDALKQVTNFIYNLDDSIAQTIYTNPSNANPLANSYMTYDPTFNRLTSATNAWGSINYSYNPYVTDPSGTPTTGAGKVASVSNNVIANSTVTYTYDALNRIINRQINGSANSTNYTYDQMGRMTKELNNLGNFGYNYIDNVSGYSTGSMRLQNINYPNSMTANFNYYGPTNDNRLASIGNVLANGQALSNFTYSYDAFGNITNWQKQQSGQSNLVNNYSYDNGNELINATGNYVNSSPPNLNINNYGYDNAYNITGKQNSGFAIATIGGTVTAGDTIEIYINNNSRIGSLASITYTVQSGDTLNTIANNIVSLLNQSLNTAGFQSLYAYANNNIINMRYTYAGSITFEGSSYPRAGARAGVGAGAGARATETITIGSKQNSVMNLTIAGVAKASDVLTITINDKSLSGGSVALNYSVKGSDTLNSIASSFTSLINTNSALSALGITANVYNNLNTIQVASASPNTTTYTRNRSGGATENIVFSINQNGLNNLNISGSSTANDTINVTVFDTGLSGGNLTLTYTVSSSDTLNSIASNVASQINNNATLKAIGVSASVIPTSSVVTLNSTSINTTTYRANTNSSASEYVVAGLNTNGTNVVTFSGTVIAGQTVTLQIFDNNLSGGSLTLTYTIQSSDTLTTIVANIASLVNSNSTLQAIGVTATSNSTNLYLKSISSCNTTYIPAPSNPADLTLNLSSGILNTGYVINNLNQVTELNILDNVPVTGKANKALKVVTINGNNANLNYSQKYTGEVVPNNNLEKLTVTATDGANNQVTNNYYAPLVGNNQEPVFITYDANGNTITDNLNNTYIYDTQNRLMQSHNGSGGVSNFVYDALGHCVKITESSSGIITSLKQFIWCGNQRCEVRDVNGGLVNQYFNYGQVNFTNGTGTNYYYTKDHLSSIRELVDARGNIQAQYSYSAFGEVTKLAGLFIDSDFQYAGYYYHQPSSLNLTMYRAYNATLHRWLTRDLDPIGEAGGVNLYAYVGNDPIDRTDPSGLLMSCKKNRITQASKTRTPTLYSRFSCKSCNTSRNL